jgi:hypothetical protein
LAKSTGEKEGFRWLLDSLSGKLPSDLQVDVVLGKLQQLRAQVQCSAFDANGAIDAVEQRIDPLMQRCADLPMI